MSSSSTQPSLLQTIDTDYIRPCKMKGTPRVLNPHANQQRFWRTKQSLKKLGLDRAIAKTLPNQADERWDAERTRPEMWAWAEKNIPGWIGKFREGFEETGARRIEDIKGKSGQYGTLFEPVAVADGGRASRISRKRKRDAKKAASLRNARDTKRYYIDREDRPWDPAYDTEPPEDDLPFPGYFTTWGKVKRIVGEKQPNIIALIPEAKRDLYGTRKCLDGDDGFMELGLEVLPLLGVKKKGRR